MKIANWIDGKQQLPADDKWLDKYNPHNGQLLSLVADSSAADTQQAVSAAARAFPAWAELTPVRRGQILA